MASAAGLPQLDYKVIILVTGILVALGLMISLSASMVTSRGTDGSGSVFSQFLRQAVIVLVGLAVMWGALRIRPAKLRAWAPGFLFVAVALLLLVLVIGVGDDIGSRSWIALGPLSFQPSEIAKLALSVWGAAAVSMHTRRNPDIRNGLGPFIAVSFAILLLVLLQRDLGMMFSSHWSCSHCCCSVVWPPGPSVWRSASSPWSVPSPSPR